MIPTTPTYTENLNGIDAIEVELKHSSIAFEANDDLTDTVQFLVDSGDNAPTMRRDGARIRIEQSGRYDGTGTPVVQVPAGFSLPIATSIREGSFALDRINSQIALNVRKGDVSISGGRGNAGCNVQRGDLRLTERDGDLAINVNAGDVALTRCSGNASINISKGDLAVVDCDGSAHFSIARGDVALARPREMALELNVSKGDVAISGGSLRLAKVDVTRGDIVAKSRLLYTGEEEPDLEELEDLIGDEPTAEQENVHFTLGGIEFYAGGEGVRFSRGGTDFFRAGPEGVEVRRGDGSELFVASDKGVVGQRPSRNQVDQYRFNTQHGDVHLEISDDQAARVELLIMSGTVQSDVPLVEVGRPGPRGTTRRYVGVTDSNETERILVRARATHGDLTVRTSAMRDTAATRPTPHVTPREERRRDILTALSQGKISVDEAQILIAAIDREG